MKLPYSNATSGKNAINEVQKILRRFDCTKFATGEDFETGEIFIQFEHRGRMVNLKASAHGYAAAWLQENPWNQRRQSTELQHKQKALEIGSVAVCSILRDWVKAQVMAIEAGVFDFETAFLSHLMLPNGRSVTEEVHRQKLLQSPEAE